MKSNHFSKRAFTPRLFFQRTADILLHLPDLARLRRSRKLPRPFAEKLMLAVTQVNDCRYCSFYHTRLALRAGVSPEEVRQLMQGSLGAFPPEQAVALAFAQSWAEQDCHQDPAEWQRLVSYYGLESAREIMVYLRLIAYGNLLGNTFDALLFSLQNIGGSVRSHSAASRRPTK